MSLVVHREVAETLERAGAVVALETAVVTAGLPEPVNLEAARAQLQAVRDGGAVPAMVGVLDGVLHVGLDDGQLERVASQGASIKAAARDLAPLMAGGPPEAMRNNSA